MLMEVVVSSEIHANTMCGGEEEKIKMFPQERKHTHKGKFINLDSRNTVRKKMSANGFSPDTSSITQSKETLRNKKTAKMLLNCSR